MVDGSSQSPMIAGSYWKVDDTFLCLVLSGPYETYESQLG